jgi:hypothetical protein
MRQGAAAVAFTGILIALTATTARAFVLGHDSQGRLRRWPEEMPHVTFVANSEPLTPFPNFAQTSLIEAAVTEALRTWTLNPVTLDYGGSVNRKDATLDGRNLIAFGDTPENRDIAGDSVTTTVMWTRVQGNYAALDEADIVCNPAQPFATDGRSDAYDLQSVLTTSLGSALGLSRSAVAAASRYLLRHKGDLSARSLEPDDVAGLRTLYGVTDPSTGSIAGYVESTEGRPQFGAHVVATDRDGIARVGVLTSKDGHFTLPFLPPGEYQVYAEPLDGPVTPDDLELFYARARTRFRTMFAGGNLVPAAVAVVAGQTTQIDTIRVEALTPSFNVQFLGWSPDGVSFTTGQGAVQLRPGTSGYLWVVGAGVNTVPDLGFRTAGYDLILDTSRVRRSNPTVTPPGALIPIGVYRGARPGARNLYLANGLERAAFTGCIEVVSP